MQLDAREIAAKRKELGLTQKEFAAALGMGTSGERTVRRWEAGDTKPTPAECAYIASFGPKAPYAQGERSDAPFTYCDLFAGIGGIRLPFQELGGRCVFSCEWDRFAQKTYRMNFGEVPAGDIRQVASSDIPDFDVLLAGFPCQPFSLAGVSKKQSMGRPTGFEDKTQGTLFLRWHASFAINSPGRSFWRTLRILRVTIMETLLGSLCRLLQKICVTTFT